MKILHIKVKGVSSTKEKRKNMYENIVSQLKKGFLITDGSIEVKVLETDIDKAFVEAE